MITGFEFKRALKHAAQSKHAGKLEQRLESRDSPLWNCLIWII